MSKHIGIYPYRKPTLMPLCDLTLNPIPKPTPMPTYIGTFPIITCFWPTSSPQGSILPSYVCNWPLPVQPSNSPVQECFPLRSEISYVTPGTVPDTPVDNMI